MTFALPAVAGLKSRLVHEEEQGRMQSAISTVSWMQSARIFVLVVMAELWYPRSMWFLGASGGAVPLKLPNVNAGSTWQCSCWRDASDACEHRQSRKGFKLHIHTVKD